MSDKNWGGRFEQDLDAAALAFSASIDVDKRLAPQDIRGSIAHARMLGARGIISQDDADRIVAGLAQLAQEIESGAFVWDASKEDVHMNVEVALSARIGDAGARLHTGRSRNDQVATDMRMWTREACIASAARIDALLCVLCERATGTVDVLLPGYTHLQRAQPVRLAHHLLAWCEMLERDRERLLDAARRMNRSPLGSGALAATTFPLDREATARELGFDGVTRNSLDAVGDRDFAIELVAAIALAQIHLSRLGEELVLWTTSEFGFVRIGEAYCSGSSLMPQKMNPDLAELLRGKSGRAVGAWVTLMTVVKGLPLAYNKDLQETQEPLYDAVETLDACLAVARGMIDSLEFDTARLRAAVDAGHLVATELADYLVTRGVAFREAHDIAGALVRRASERGVELAALSLDELRALHPAFGPDVAGWLDPARAVDRRDLVGGPARGRVLAEIERIEAELGPSAPGR
jgi:argininosuccinate lyase